VTNTTCPLARNPAPARSATAGYESVAGAVLRSARLSARVSQARLAAACGVTENTIRAWENGSSPLASTPMPQVEAVIAALHQAGACRLLTADLVVAAWCDLVIAAVAAREDPTCLMADPITADRAFGELMAWCLEGRVPQRYRPYATTGQLLRDQALIERTRRALD
jgi:transcriptional regulator with XRE-family HTH domain